MKFFFVLFLILPLTFAQGTPSPSALPLSDDPEILAMIERLLATPVLYNMDTQAVKDIYARGLELGNRPDVFTKIGDSNTTSGDFLQPMGLESPPRTTAAKVIRSPITASRRKTA
jgi:hypothetical protein